MNTKKKLLTLLSLAGIGFSAPAANAATVAYNSGDLILGFRYNDGTAGSFTYLVDLGQESAFRDYASGAPTTSTVVGTGIGNAIGNIASDLAAIFGANWYQDPNLYWGVVGTPGASAQGGDGVSTLYATKPEATFGTPGTGFNQANAFTQGPARSNIVNLGATINGQTSYGTSNFGVEQAAATTNGWESQTGGGNDFAYFGNIENTFSGGAATSALDLFRMATSPTGVPGSYEGTFFWTNVGSTTATLNFGAPAAAPEPSRAVLLVAGLGGIIFRRRRSVTKA